MNSPKYLPILRLSAAALLVFTMWGCNEETPPPGGSNNNNNQAEWKQETADIMCDIVNNVMLPIVYDFDQEAADLNAAIITLNGQRTEQNFEAAKQAWRDTRRPWEMCEAYLFGPAKVQQLDPAVDSWPLDQITLDSMLNSNDVFTKEYFDVSEGTVKGAHAIEYILWGDKGDKTVDKITDREYQFLLAATESFRESTAKLKKAWAPTSEGGDGYGKQLCDAGKPGAGSIYSTQTAGLREIVTGLFTILIEVSDAKMGIPFSQQNNDFEEARFSNNSIPDFMANILGVQSIYMGTYGSRSGKGLSDLIKSKDAALDTRIQGQIQTCLTRISAITPSFSEAITNNRNAIQTARFAVTELATSFEKDVSELLGTK